MTARKMDEDQIIELIQSKIALEKDISGDWVVALVLLRMMPILRKIADNLDAIDRAIDPDLSGRLGPLSDIAHSLRKLVDLSR